MTKGVAASRACPMPGARATAIHGTRVMSAGRGATWLPGHATARQAGPGIA
ncbi:MAG: hypothetical protein L0H23_10655 [Luteimonas sp.]|nr:hypothetical protein [Luteimonas sp.]